MQTEDDFLRLIQLRSAADPPGWDLQNDEHGLRLTVRPGLPLMAYVTCLVLAPGGFVGAGIAMGNPWLLWGGVALAIGSTALFVSLHKREIRLGPYAVWDRATGRMQLDRLKAAFGPEDMLGLQLLHAFQSDAQGNPGANISELHLIVKAGEDAIERYPLIAWNPKRPIQEVAQQIADELGLEVRRWRTGKKELRPTLRWPRARGPYPKSAWG